MAGIYLNVPFVTQLGFGDPTDPQNDSTGCWYSSSCMVAYYFEAGPRLGMPEKYDPAKRRHAAIKVTEYPKLIVNEHLAIVPLPTDNKWTVDAIADLLRRYGPLSFSRFVTSKGKRYGHRSVIIGCEEKPEQIIFHDPENRPNSRVAIETFNDNFRWDNPYSMLRRDGPELVRTAVP